MIYLLRRPWREGERATPEDRVTLGPGDCFLVETPAHEIVGERWPVLLGWKGGRDLQRRLRLVPYPKSGRTPGPLGVEGLPVRPKPGAEPRDAAEAEAQRALDRMNRVLARIQDLEGALDDPEHLWDRLAVAWCRASDEEIPRMAEIVRQARDLGPCLRALEGRLRRILRRTRETTPIDRVQEMDRASMRWLSRQPGSTIAERAGSAQRIMAIVRRESFDTLENRVVHAYAALAARVARDWLREHDRARRTQRFREVEDYRRYCRTLVRRCTELGIGRAEPGVIANYVLTEDRDYRLVREGWERLLQAERRLDDLWAWQAESWTDFCTLAVILALHALPEARLVAQYPIVWRGEAVGGRFFASERDLVTFWLRESGLIVEVQSRPQGITGAQAHACAVVWLRVSGLDTDEPPRRVAIWTPHSFERSRDLMGEAVEAAARLRTAPRAGERCLLREGLILSQAFGVAETCDAKDGGCRVRAVALDAAGTTLADGQRAIAAFVRGLVDRASSA